MVRTTPNSKTKTTPKAKAKPREGMRRSARLSGEKASPITSPAAVRHRPSRSAPQSPSPLTSTKPSSPEAEPSSPPRADGNLDISSYSDAEPVTQLLSITACRGSPGVYDSPASTSIPTKSTDAHEQRRSPRLNKLATLTRPRTPSPTPPSVEEMREMTAPQASPPFGSPTPASRTAQLRPSSPVLQGIPIARQPKPKLSAEAEKAEKAEKAELADAIPSESATESRAKPAISFLSAVETNDPDASWADSTANSIAEELAIAIDTPISSVSPSRLASGRPGSSTSPHRRSLKISPRKKRAPSQAVEAKAKDSLMQRLKRRCQPVGARRAITVVAGTAALAAAMAAGAHYAPPIPSIVGSYTPSLLPQALPQLHTFLSGGQVSGFGPALETTASESYNATSPPGRAVCDAVLGLEAILGAWMQ